VVFSEIVDISGEKKNLVLGSCSLGFLYDHVAVLTAASDQFEPPHQTLGTIQKGNHVMER
jgi:hypothetical protein